MHPELERVDLPNRALTGVHQKRFDLTSSYFRRPIELTPNERNLMKLNNPITIEYLVRPKQMLILMEH